MMETDALIAALQKYRGQFHPVVPFEPGKDRLSVLDFTAGNSTLTAEVVANTDLFAAWVEQVLRRAGARYGIGGYGEHRTIYARSDHFGTGSDAARQGAGGETAVPDEPRRLHLGIDIWGPAGTRIMSPMDGIIHSFAFNNNDSDYGATLIVTHNLDGESFHLLYGHLSLNSLKNLHEGMRVRRGETIAETGMRFENGNWPPHLHFQMIRDMGDWKGDYPGVCRYSEREKWMKNCPDADLVLQLMQYADR